MIERIQLSVLQDEESVSFCSNEERELAHLFLNRVRHYIPERTNPKVIATLLEAMHLDTMETHDPHFQHYLQEVTSHPLDLSALIDKTHQDILNNKPLCKLLASIQEKGLIPDRELQQYIATLTVQINLLHFFEAFVVTMINSPIFAEELYQHIIKRRNISSPGNSYMTFLFGVPQDTSMFLRLKLISVEPIMLNYIFHRRSKEHTETKDELKEFIHQYHLSGPNAQHMGLAKYHKTEATNIAAMSLNILEAAWEQIDNKHAGPSDRDNSMAGLGLIALMERLNYLTQFKYTSAIIPEETHITPEGTYSLIPELGIDSEAKKISQFYIDKEWRDLYNSWNMQFCIANIESVFLPLKLLMPSVFSAEAKNFKETRVISLYLFANILFNEQIGKNPLFQPSVQFEHQNTLLQEWGAINKEYSAYLLQTKCPDFQETPESLYDKSLGKAPTWNFLSDLYRYSKQTTEFREFCQVPPKAKSQSSRSTNLFSFFCSTSAQKSTTDSPVSEQQIPHTSL